jgi:hypothetical protein
LEFRDSYQPWSRNVMGHKVTKNWNHHRQESYGEQDWGRQPRQKEGFLAGLFREWDLPRDAEVMASCAAL